MKEKSEFTQRGCELLACLGKSAMSQKELRAVTGKPAMHEEIFANQTSRSDGVRALEISCCTCGSQRC